MSISKKTQKLALVQALAYQVTVKKKAFAFTCFSGHVQRVSVDIYPLDEKWGDNPTRRDPVYTVAFYMDRPDALGQLNEVIAKLSALLLDIKEELPA